MSVQTPLVLNKADLERDVASGSTVALAEVLAELKGVVEQFGFRAPRAVD